MNIATIKVSGVKAVTNDYPTIPAGIVGATVTFEFTDPAWDGLNKTAVFRGCVTRDVLMTGKVVRIPAETVAQACPFLFVGVYGTDAADNLVIPTLWLSLGAVRDAADPSGDPGTDPDLPVWAQLQNRVEALESGTPSGPDSPGTPGRPGKDGEDGGYYTPAVTQPSSDTVEFAFSPSKPDMPAVDPVQVKLPVSQNSGGNVDCLLTVETITIGEPGEPEIPVTGINLDYSTISLTEGEGMMLAASVIPSNATNKTVLWKSSNTSIAAVNNGYVTAVAEGDAVITAYSAENNSFEATCNVAVAAAESGGDDIEKTLTSISATYSGGEVTVGTALTDLTGIVVTAHYSDGTRETVTGYTLSGMISEGDNTIAVTYEGKTATFTVTGISESGTVKVQFSTLERTSGLLKKDGKSVYADSSAYHVEFPFIDGMFVSTATNDAWLGNYPPFIVVDNGSATIPEYTEGSGTAPNNYGKHYVATLTGFTESAKVYANFLINPGSRPIEEVMDNADVYYYSYET